MRSHLQHHLNAMHVYCRLHPFLGRRLARRLAGSWERTRVYRTLYRPAISLA